MHEVDQSSTRPHYFFTSVTRNSDLWKHPFEAEHLQRSQWATGDFVVGRVFGRRNRLFHCETKTGRMAGIARGDLLVGALGQRAATLEGVGDWRAIGTDCEMEALTSAGLFGKGTSMSAMLPDFVRLSYCGHVMRDGHKLAMADFIATPAVSEFAMPVIILVGTSMSSGKTTSGQIIIRALRFLGLRVTAAKLTGAARYRDILSFRDAGAEHVFDFVDAGLPSTVCDESIYKPALGLLLGHIMATGSDVAVIEAGASPLEPYNGSMVMEQLHPHVRMSILCAMDPYAALGVQHAFAPHLVPELVAGPATNTDAGVKLVRRLTGLPALNLLDRTNHPRLLRCLKKALELA